MCSSRRIIVIGAVAVASLVVSTVVWAGEMIPDRAGFAITSTSSVKPGTYVLSDPSDSGAVVVEGDGITVDFGGAIIVGAAENATPDMFVGRGIVVRGKNVTIKNVHVRGYRVGIYAKGAVDLRLEGCDVSGNFRQRLASTPEREDASDWLFGHDNDDGEWLRYGAGIYLDSCLRAVVSDCVSRRGQNGICLSSCDDAYIVDNDMSYMSGWGLAMWRCNRCYVMNNRFDFCVRGYSHGVYERGQDSAGILVYEQCCDNVIAYNSATHSGDGLFMYAGNETLRQTGRGGCLRNLVYRNDFSYAIANGIESTFCADNIFLHNIIKECKHGVWAGYSRDTVIEENLIERCKRGVSIEHGQGNLVVDNTIKHAEIGVDLWCDDDPELLSSEYCKSHGGCPSRNNKIVDNDFAHVELAIRLDNDQDSLACRNRFGYTERAIELAGDVGDLRATLDGWGGVERHGNPIPERYRVSSDSVEPWPRQDLDATRRLLEDKQGDNKPVSSKRVREGKRHIFVDEWGPYDYSGTRVSPAHACGGREAVFYVLGPGTKFKLAEVVGDVKVSAKSGTMPMLLRVEATTPGLTEFSVRLRTRDGELSATGTLFSAEWKVQRFSWSDDCDPRKGGRAWKTVVSGAATEIDASAIDFAWGYGSPAEGVNADHFATVASADVDLPAGSYRFTTMSDDGVRLFVDDKLVLENWTHHAPTSDEATVDVSEGKHSLRIEHFEIDGFARLGLRVSRVR